MSHDLPPLLRQAVRAQGFEHTPDALRGGAPLDAFPSIDLAVALFEPGQPPRAANVLFSREHPQGVRAELPADFGPAQGIAFQADVQDADGVSCAWLPGADWSRLDFPALAGSGTRFVAPYPASLLKLMVATGVSLALERLPDALGQAWHHDGETRALQDWQHAMLALSCNRSTDALVAWLHTQGVLGGEPHALHRLFEALRLPTLRLARTRPDGGWRNADGAGVGQLQMTAWDSLRLLWWLHPALPPCPWTARPRLRHSEALWQALRDQTLPGFVQRRPGFAHKTGNTENYASDAGLLELGDGRRLLLAVLSNLGARYAQGAPGGFPAQLVGLGEAVVQALA